MGYEIRLNYRCAAAQIKGFGVQQKTNIGCHFILEWATAYKPFIKVAFQSI